MEGKLTTIQIGAWGEEQAALFLVRQGYEIVDRNYRAMKAEIDIVAWHAKYHWGRTLCFIEVKTRTFDDGSAERATREEKKKHIRRAAAAYCIERGIDTMTTPIQFEQISVYADKKTKRVRLRMYVIPLE